MMKLLIAWRVHTAEIHLQLSARIRGISRYIYIYIANFMFSQSTGSELKGDMHAHTHTQKA